MKNREEMLFDRRVERRICWPSLIRGPVVALVDTSPYLRQVLSHFSGRNSLMPDTGLKKRRRIRVDRGRENLKYVEDWRLWNHSFLQLLFLTTSLSHNFSFLQLLFLTTSLSYNFSFSLHLTTTCITATLHSFPLHHLVPSTTPYTTKPPLQKGRRKKKKGRKKKGRKEEVSSASHTGSLQCTVEIRFQGRKRREWMSCRFMMGILIMQNGH